MKLSKELEMWRCDRPDEWKMDEFRRNAERLEDELVSLDKDYNCARDAHDNLLVKIEALKAERDALAAQVENILAEFKDARETLQTIAGCTWDSGAEEIADVALDEAKRWVSRYDDSVLKKVPMQHLAEIRAEAVDGLNSNEQFEAFLKTLVGSTNNYEIGNWLDQYAEQIRRGG